MNNRDDAPIVDQAPGTDENAPATTSPYKLRLKKPHRLIQNTQNQHNARGEDGYRLNNAPKGVDIRVSRPKFKAGLVVMDRFIKALEKRDLTVEVSREFHGTDTFVCQGRDRIPIHIAEKYKRVEHVPTAKELREKEQFSWKKIPKWDDAPTGCLELVPGGPVDLSSDHAIDVLVEKAVADTIEKLSDVRERREANEAIQRREYERQQQIRDEQGRVEAMLKSAESLHRYRILMEYIEEVRRFGRIPDKQRRNGQSLDEWLNWAYAQAQQIHPLG